MTSKPSNILWLGNLPEQLDPARDIVFRSLALAGREADLAAYAERGLFAAEEFQPDDISEAELVVQQAYREVALPYLSSLLKEQRSPAFSLTSLSILGGGWVMSLLQNCWLNYRILERHMEALGDTPVIAVVPESLPFAAPPRDSKELINRLFTEEFQAWVASRFLLAKKPRSWQISTYVPVMSIETTKPNRLVSKWLSRLRSGLSNFLKVHRCTSQQFPWLWRLLFGVMLGLRKIKLDANVGDHSVAVPYDTHLHDTQLPATFLAVMGSILGECTPAFFGEGFAHYAGKVRREESFRAGFARITGSNIYSDEENLRKALAYEAREVVLSLQHGGCYGVQKVMPLSPQTEYLGGLFVSWGWTRHKDYAVKVLPMPSPSLSRLAVARRRALRTPDIIFVGADMNPGVLRIQSKPHGIQWLDYRQQKVDFLDVLSCGTRGNIVYRGYFTGTLSDEEFLRGKHPDLRICEGSRQVFHRTLLSAAACVIDHPITSFHQTLAMNLPTIAYWNPDHWAFCADAVPLFEELESAGILHRSGREAGYFLETNKDQLNIWWESNAVQSARRLWCSYYARTSPHWVREWISRLWGPKG